MLQREQRVKGSVRTSHLSFCCRHSLHALLALGKRLFSFSEELSSPAPTLVRFLFLPLLVTGCVGEPEAEKGVCLNSRPSMECVRMQSGLGMSKESVATCNAHSLELTSQPPPTLAGRHPLAPYPARYLHLWGLMLEARVCNLLTSALFAHHRLENLSIRTECDA